MNLPPPAQGGIAMPACWVASCLDRWNTTPHGPVGLRRCSQRPACPYSQNHSPVPFLLEPCPTPRLHKGDPIGEGLSDPARQELAWAGD